MDKHSSSKSNPVGAPAFDTAQAPKQLAERNLLETSPLKEQFSPTEAMPVRMRFKMAGGA